MAGASLSLNCGPPTTWLRNSAVTSDCACATETPGLRRATMTTQKVKGSARRSFVPHHSLRTRLESASGIKKSCDLPGVR